jgi:hypothetical protein
LKNFLSQIYGGESPIGAKMKKQTDRLRAEKIRGQGPKEIFGESAQKHDISVSNVSKVAFET